jgi:hypothetical protein
VAADKAAMGSTVHDKPMQQHQPLHQPWHLALVVLWLRLWGRVGCGRPALLAAAALLGAPGCGETLVEYEALDLLLTAESTDPVVVRLQIALRNTTGDTPYAAPAQPGDSQFEPTLPKDWSLVAKPWRLRIQQPPGNQGKLAIRIAGLDASGTLRAAYSGVIDTRKKGEQALVLLAIGGQPQCDADADGVPACKPSCLSDPAAQCDCNEDATLGGDGKPKGAAASPFFVEDPCLHCGDGVDQNCDGSDVACVDSDGDKVADCQEKSCPPGGDKDPTVYPGAAERCNGVDDDCDGEVDDGLPYTDISGAAANKQKGQPCGAGLGRCDGGTVVCAAAGPDGQSTSLVCSTAGQKQASEDCSNAIDDDCDGDVNDGCASQDLDGDGVPNDQESEALCPLFPLAMYHAEYYPGATEGCCPAGKADAACDYNCDGKVSACPANDQDGDGVSVPADCNDADPAVYPGAPQQCGDGQKPCPIDSDPPCTNDKDGDKYNADVDCNDNDALVYPGAAERCNGLDDDCDGKKDEGAPEALDAACGDPDGECGKVPGVLVCKHYPTGAKPDAADCATRAFDPTSATCIGCHGDVRPTAELCNTQDEDCDGSSDEDFTYAESGGAVRPMFGPCDGIGQCGSGVVECASTATTRCSTDVGGSAAGNQPEVCNNLDDSCNGQTDENLTSVSDSLCRKVGVCGSGVGQISTVCTAGIWLCDYSKVAKLEYNSAQACDPATGACQCPGGGAECSTLVEASCDGLDNDCDGLTDDDFAYQYLGSGPILGIGDGCGTGDCSGGKVVCSGDALGLQCSSLGQKSQETCNSEDDDCDGQTDEAGDLPVTASTCLVTGVCTTANVTATCPAGQWVCDYSAVPTYQAASETSCDGADNDCDGQTDEDFAFVDWNLASRTVGQTCGTGKCTGGKVVCAGGATGLTCSSLTLQTASPEPACNGEDDDCDGSTDEDFAYTQQDGAVVGIGAACDGMGACGLGTVECQEGVGGAVCSSDAVGSGPQVAPESCNEVDDDCDGATDEGCDDDGDLWCTAAMTTVGKPAVCPLGGGDCAAGNPAVSPGAQEVCDGVDNDCSGGTDTEFVFVQASGLPAAVSEACGTGACSGGVVVCGATGDVALCSTSYLASDESCNGLDDDCDGATDEGCDDDQDGFCDAALVWTPDAYVTCPKTTTTTALDCADEVTAVNPAAAEVCDDVDNNCSAGTDEGCDDDGDDFCDAAMETLTSTTCSKGGGDCDDLNPAIQPDAAEICDDVDNDCDLGPDNGCDNDGDQFCDATMQVVGAPASCPKSAAGQLDCEDGNGAVFPGATEICNDIDDGCSDGVDEGCDDDGDDHCDAAMTVVGQPAVCPASKANTADDCDDGNDQVYPGQMESCNGGIDDDCSGSADGPDSLACTYFYLDADGDGWGSTVKQCLCLADSAAKYTALVGGDCVDDNNAIYPQATETCATAADDNCNGSNNDPDALQCSDFALDGDGDGYASAGAMTQCLCQADPAGKYTVSLPADPTDCNDSTADVKPGIQETCGNGVDDNCSAGTDEGCPK